MFVTSDREHVDRLQSQGIGHHGIVFLPSGWDPDGKVALTAELAKIVKRAISGLGSTGFDTSCWTPTGTGSTTERGAASAG